MFNIIRCLVASIFLLTGCLQQAPRLSGINPFAGEEVMLMEINSVPKPFDINGNDPYVVWINGKKVDPPMEYIEALVHKVGKENIPELNMEDIHGGWLHPMYLKLNRAEERKNQRVRLVTEQ
ncbi:MAG: hypothetical protein CL885_01895 [Dehalococcoidia bacterium]|nr:hypothetical protein [Dehalococcoidia bacterium]